MMRTENAHIPIQWIPDKRRPGRTILKAGNLNILSFCPKTKQLQFNASRLPPYSLCPTRDLDICCDLFHQIARLAFPEHQMAARTAWVIAAPSVPSALLAALTQCPEEILARICQTPTLAIQIRLWWHEQKVSDCHPDPDLNSILQSLESGQLAVPDETATVLAGLNPRLLSLADYDSFTTQRLSPRTVATRIADWMQANPKAIQELPPEWQTTILKHAAKHHLFNPGKGGPKGWLIHRLTKDILAKHWKTSPGARLPNTSFTRRIDYAPDQVVQTARRAALLAFLGWTGRRAATLAASPQTTAKALGLPELILEQYSHFLFAFLSQVQKHDPASLTQRPQDVLQSCLRCITSHQRPQDHWTNAEERARQHLATRVPAQPLHDHRWLGFQEIEIALRLQTPMDRAHIRILEALKPLTDRIGPDSALPIIEQILDRLRTACRVTPQPRRQSFWPPTATLMLEDCPRDDHPAPTQLAQQLEAAATFLHQLHTPPSPIPTGPEADAMHSQFWRGPDGLPILITTPNPEGGQIWIGHPANDQFFLLILHPPVPPCTTPQEVACSLRSTLAAPRTRARDILATAAKVALDVLHQTASGRPENRPAISPSYPCPGIDPVAGLVETTPRTWVLSPGSPLPLLQPWIDQLNEAISTRSPVVLLGTIQKMLEDKGSPASTQIIQPRMDGP